MNADISRRRSVDWSLENFVGPNEGDIVSTETHYDISYHLVVMNLGPDGLNLQALHSGAVWHWSIRPIGAVYPRRVIRSFGGFVDV